MLPCNRGTTRALDGDQGYPLGL